VTVIYFLIIALAAAVLLYAVISSPKKRSRHGSKHHFQRPVTGPLDRGEVAAKWATIMAASQTGASGMKSSITEADKLFDSVLMQIGTPGGTMGERLKAARSRFRDYGVYDGVWRAHKLRNSLAHDIGFDLVISQAKEALGGFERGLKELGVL
jgi:hypothetical protein